MPNQQSPSSIADEQFYKSYKFINRCKKLTLSEKGLLTYILSFQDKCWSSNSTIATELGLSVSTVNKTNASLAKKGLLQITVTKHNNIDSHVLVVNQPALIQFINDEPINTPPPPIVEPIAPEPIVQPVAAVKASRSSKVTPEPQQVESLFFNYTHPITNEQKLEIYQLRLQSIYNRPILNELDNLKYANVEPGTIINTIKERLGITV